MPVDIGRFVGGYLQFMAGLSVVGMILSPLLFGPLHIDFTILLLLWAAPGLKRHDPKFRKGMIQLCTFGIVVIVGLVTYSLFAGTAGLEIWIMGITLQNPSLHVLLIVANLTALAFVIPLALLLTPQARREFQVPAKPPASPPEGTAGPDAS